MSLTPETKREPFPLDRRGKRTVRRLRSPGLHSRTGRMQSIADPLRVDRLRGRKGQDTPQRAGWRTVSVCGGQGCRSYARSSYPSLLCDEASLEHPAVHDLPLIAAASKREKIGPFAPQCFELADTGVRPAIRDGGQAFAHFLQYETAGLILSHDLMDLVGGIEKWNGAFR